MSRLDDPNDDPTEHWDYDPEEAEEDSWWDEGLITLLLVAGVALFLFPEPATSGLGILLILAGALAWVMDSLR